MTEQLKYDTKAILPVLKDMLDRESEKTSGLSDKLITIGELAVASSLVIKETKANTKDGNDKLDTLTNQQEKLVDTLATLTTMVEQVKSGSDLTEELRNDFRDQLNKVIENHTSDKDDILEHISKVYTDYTNRVIELSGAITTLNETLTNPEYKNRVENLMRELIDVKTSIAELKEQHDKNTKAQLERIESLVTQLTTVDESFGKFINDTESNQEVVTKVVQHINIIEDRLDSLLAVNISQDAVGGDK